MNYEKLVKLVRPGAVEKMGAIIDADRRIIGASWQDAFESLPEWEQAKALVLEKWPDAVSWEGEDYKWRIGIDYDHVDFVFAENEESAWLNALKNMNEKEEQ